MHAVRQAEFRVVNLSTLTPGQLFIHDLEKPGSIAIAMAPEDGQLVYLGVEDFKLGAFPKGRDRKVLATGLDLSILELKVDFASGATNYADHIPGQLMVGDDDGASIAATWPQFEHKHYRNVVLLNGWRQSIESEPRYLFDRWSLGLVQGATWVDVVTRGPT